MREALRGYTAAQLDLLAPGEQTAVAAQLSRVSSALGTSAELRGVLCDSSVGLTVRAGVVEELLVAALPAVRALIAFVVRTEPAAEVGAAVTWLTERVGAADPDPLGGHLAINERLEGYAQARLERAADAQVDTVETQLRQAAGVLAGNRALREALADLSLPVELRVGVMTDLFASRVDPTSLSLLRYAAAENQGQLGARLEWLAGRVAEERGRRSATVTAAVDLDAGERAQLVAALSRLTGRAVSLDVTIDPTIIGGLNIVVGDTVLDGTVRSRLDQARTVLAAGNSQLTRH